MMFEARRAKIAGEIAKAFARVLEGLPAGELRDAMGWALAGGKSVRGFLVIESADLYGVPKALALKAALAVEALHTYSLIHDDLPDMDDDDLRRGRATVHIKWSTATAILAGDALQALAFSLLSAPLAERGAQEAHSALAPARLRLIAKLADAAGAHGMVGGQICDLAAEKAPSPLDIAAIEALQQKKTGALIRWASESGAIMAGEDPAPLRRYGTALGLAFQISDDLLDATETTERVGKKTGKDHHAHKATFITALGIEGARRKAEELIGEAKSALDIFGARANALKALADFVVTRNY